MLFSKMVKEELCNVIPYNSDCQVAELYGMLMFSKAYKQQNFAFQTPNKFIADRLVDFMVSQFKVIVSISASVRKAKTKLHTVTIDNKADQQQIRDIMQDQNISEITQDKNSKAAFIRGAYLVCGSIVDPNKEYHLEFSNSSYDLSTSLVEIISEMDIPIKLIKRKNSFVSYIKESEDIEDILTIMGATKCSLEIMNIKILKDVRNNVNRVTNCETANIEKTVKASYDQINDIKLIKKLKGLDYLPKGLKQIAVLRLENPEMSLSEMAEFLSYSISKSGINHRLKRISQIADKLR